MAELPLTFMIPVPVQLERARGRASTSGPEKCFLQCRGTKMERAAIEQAADICGVSSGTFMRFTVMAMAEAVIKAHNNDSE